MDNGFIFLIFVLYLAFCVSFLFNILCKKSNTAKCGMVKLTFFLFTGYCFLLSMVKWYLASREESLVESFWDSSKMTYIHYGIPLIIASIVVLIILETILKKVAEKFIKIYVIYMFSGIMLVFFCRGRISNAVYCLLFFCCFIITWITILKYDKKLEYVEKKEYLKVFFNSLPYVGTVFFMNGIFLPNELYLNNVNEFGCPYREFFIILLIGALVGVCLFIWLSMMLLPKGVYKCLRLVVAGVAIMGYIQNMFFNGKLELMDGQEQIWSAKVQIVNIVIWLLVISCIAFWGYKKQEIEKLVKLACIYIVLIQTVTIGYLLITTEQIDKQQSALTIEGSLELGTDNNIIVFVLDRFDSRWMEELLEQEGEFFEPLADFTYYNNATSQFAHTGTALPYMLTGVEWTEEMKDITYSDYAYENSNFMETVKQHNYNMGIYTQLGYLVDSIYRLADNYNDEVDISCDIEKTLELMLKSSMYKTTPFALKSAYRYYSGDITQMEKADEIWNIDNDLPFYNRLVEEGLEISDEYQNAFRFYHMRGAHHPYYLSDELQYDKVGRDVSVYSQIKGCLKIVYEYMEQLKELGKYDEATIVITADHGQQIELIEEQNRPDKVSMPIILVKEANMKGDALQIKSIPVSHEELIPTILEAMKIDRAEYGKTYSEAVDEEKERVYMDIYKDYIIKYTIDGDAKELSNWKGISLK